MPLVEYRRRFTVIVVVSERETLFSMMTKSNTERYVDDVCGGASQVGGAPQHDDERAATARQCDCGQVGRRHDDDNDDVDRAHRNDATINAGVNERWVK